MDARPAPDTPRPGGSVRVAILDAARRLLGTAEGSDVLTLRAIAREAGIAAPSVYNHFADRDDILDTVVSHTFHLLNEACRRAAESEDTGAGQIAAIARAYVAFGHGHRSEYRILFERSPRNVASRSHAYPPGIDAFQYFLDGFHKAVAEGAIQTQNPARDAQALWAALHGLITLVPATPAFPWVATDAIVGHLIHSLSVGLSD